MNKEELTPKAKEMFENHKSENAFHATSDGNFFTDAHKESANTHAFDKKLGEVMTFRRDEFEIAKEEKGESKEDNQGEAEKGKGKKKK